MDSSTTREFAVLYNFHWVSLGSSRYQFLAELIQVGKESERKYEMLFTNKTLFCKLRNPNTCCDKLYHTTLHYTRPGKGTTF